MKQTIAFIVHCDPKPQGSKLSHAIYGRDGKPVMKNGRVITVTRNDNPDVLSWRGAVADAARHVYDGPLLTGPIKLTVLFYRPRPKGHFGSGRNANNIKESAPAYPTTKPDSTKLLRAVEDALTNVVWKDDSQIVKHDVEKNWGASEQTHVIVETLSPEAT